MEIQDAMGLKLHGFIMELVEAWNGISATADTNAAERVVRLSGLTADEIKILEEAPNESGL